MGKLAHPYFFPVGEVESCLVPVAQLGPNPNNGSYVHYLVRRGSRDAMRGPGAYLERKRERWIVGVHVRRHREPEG